MAQVMMPQKKDGLQKAAPLLSMFGGWGKAAGMVAGMAGNKPQQAAVSSPSLEERRAVLPEWENDPMKRRMQTIQDDPLQVMGEAKQSLAYMPPDIQQRYQKPIDDAYKMALDRRRQNQQMGVA